FNDEKQRIVSLKTYDEWGNLVEIETDTKVTFIERDEVGKDTFLRTFLKIGDKLRFYSQGHVVGRDSDDNAVIEYERYINGLVVFKKDLEGKTHDDFEKIKGQL